VHDSTLEMAPNAELRAGVRVSAVSIVWTLAASGASVVLGADAGSIVLIAFGLTGLLDTAGSVALVVHFRHALRHEAISERHERTAARVIAFGTITVGIVTLLASAQRLVTHGQTAASPFGTAVAAVSIPVLAVLSVRKRRVARRIPSRALEADGWLSGIGCVLACVTVAGGVVTDALGWWWADPIAASAIAVVAILTPVQLRRRERE
jgi:divalent metal cation (Fe/Co/Zn/Cd) transporter